VSAEIKRSVAKVVAMTTQGVGRRTLNASTEMSLGTCTCCQTSLSAGIKWRKASVAGCGGGRAFKLRNEGMTQRGEIARLNFARMGKTRGRIEYAVRLACSAPGVGGYILYYRLRLRLQLLAFPFRSLLGLVVLPAVVGESLYNRASSSSPSSLRVLLRAKLTMLRASPSSESSKKMRDFALETPGPRFAPVPNGASSRGRWMGPCPSSSAASSSSLRHRIRMTTGARAANTTPARPKKFRH
jgi:hypothetical protein